MHTKLNRRMARAQTAHASVLNRRTGYCSIAARASALGLRPSLNGLRCAQLEQPRVVDPSMRPWASADIGRKLT